MISERIDITLATPTAAASTHASISSRSLRGEPFIPDQGFDFPA